MDELSRTRQACIRRDNDVRTAAEQMKRSQDIFKEGMAAWLNIDFLELDLLLTPPEPQHIIAVVDEAQSSRESMEEEWQVSS